MAVFAPARTILFDAEIDGLIGGAIGEAALDELFDLSGGKTYRDILMFTAKVFANKGQTR